MQGDDFVAPDVVAGGEVLRNLDNPRVVVGDQLRRAPGAGERGVVDQTNGGDLEELKGGLVDGGAVTVAVGQHINDGADVRVRPGGPVRLDCVAGRHGGIAACVGGILVADDVAAGVGIGGNVAVVSVTGCPMDGLAPSR